MGSYSTVNPSCPGAKKVLEIRPVNNKSLTVRVHAELPNKPHSDGTRLIVNVIFRGVTERVTVEAEFPYAQVTLQNGEVKSVLLPFFEKPYIHGESDYKYGYWSPESLISAGSVENFTVLLPTIYIDGQQVNLPTVEFKLDQDKYYPVLNC